MGVSTFFGNTAGGRGVQWASQLSWAVWRPMGVPTFLSCVSVPMGVPTFRRFVSVPMGVPTFYGLCERPNGRPNFLGQSGLVRPHVSVPMGVSTFLGVSMVIPIFLGGQALLRTHVSISMRVSNLALYIWASHSRHNLNFSLFIGQCFTHGRHIWLCT